MATTSHLTLPCYGVTITLFGRTASTWFGSPTDALNLQELFEYVYGHSCWIITSRR